MRRRASERTGRDIAREAGLRRDNQKAVAAVPAAVERLAALLGADVPAELMERACITLTGLSWDVRCQARMVALPGCLEKLLRLLRDGIGDVRRNAWRVLLNIALNSDHTKAAWELPGLREVLVDLLSSDNKLACDEAVRLLVTFVEDAERRTVIASAPGCLIKLFGLVTEEAESEELAECGMHLLSRLSEAAEDRKVVLETPGILERLAEVLNSDKSSAGLVDVTAETLQNLTADPENRRVIAAVPRCLEGLVRALANAEDPGPPALAISNLAEDENVRKALAAVPGALEALAGRLSDEPLGELCLIILRKLVVDGAVGKALVGTPRSVEKLVKLKDGSGSAEVRGLAAQVLNICRESGGKRQPEALAGVPEGPPIRDGQADRKAEHEMTA